MTAQTLLRRTSSDCDLVQAMARGDQDALALLYDRYARLVLAVVQRCLGTLSEADDVAHDVFLGLWRDAASYDESRGSVRAWVALRARSRALDVRKSARIQRRIDLPDHGWVALGADVDPDSSVAPDCAQLRVALSRLPQRQQEVLLLGYFDGLSSTEIASCLNIPVGTVKSRVAGAMASLRQVMSPVEPPERHAGAGDSQGGLT